MNLTKERISEINTLLKKEKVQTPAFRSEVTLTGMNFTWLQKNILVKNPGISERLKTLLSITP